MRVTYTDVLADGRRVVIEACYEPGSDGPRAPEDAVAYPLHVVPEALLESLPPGVDRNTLDIRLELAYHHPAEYHRLRTECLDRVLLERDILSAECAELRESL